MIKYLGSKRLLLPSIVAVCDALRASGADPLRGWTVLDPFSGTARVGHALKRAGYRVIAGDHNAYAAALARCYVQADAERVVMAVEPLLEHLAALPGEDGYITETFSRQSRYLQPHNAMKVDAIRRAISALDVDDDVRAVLLVSLIEAADRVDSTVGVQMAYLKQWSPRSYNQMQLRMPDVLARPSAGACEGHQVDALELCAARSAEAEIVYLDPPYNQHSYLGNYHVWETIARGDTPAFYGTACKRVDCRTRQSRFNRRRQHGEALGELVRAIRSAFIVLSLNNECWLSPGDARDMLASRGVVTVIEHDHPRYIGSQIGIYNSQGQRVGTPGAKKNREVLLVCTPGEAPEAIERMARDQTMATVTAA